MISVLVPADDLRKAFLSISGDSYHHLVRVRRVAKDEALRLVDGEGNARWGRIESISRGEARVEILESAPTNEPRQEVELLVAAPRPSRLSWLVEKATELGVAAIRLVQTERAPAGHRPETLNRLRRVAASAVEQSHRSRLPTISGVHTWPEAREILATANCPIYFLDTQAEETDWRDHGSGRKILAVGPEGGWTDGEHRELVGLGCVPVGLGPTTLRVETAAIVGVYWMLRSGVLKNRS